MSEVPPDVSKLLDFTGKTVVVIGASGGIGAGIARRFAEAGANLVVHYRSDRAGAERAVNDLGGKAMAYHADVTDDGAVEQMMRATVDRFGHLDVLVNNAALQPQGAVVRD